MRHYKYSGHFAVAYSLISDGIMYSEFIPPAPPTDPTRRAPLVVRPEPQPTVSESNFMEKADLSKLERETYVLRAAIIGILLFVVGLLITYLAYGATTEPTRSFFGALGSTFIVSGVLSWAYELSLRQNFLAIARRTVTAAIQESGPSSLRAVIQESMPQRYANIKQAGIVDAYQSLEIDKLKQSIEAARGAQIVICKMWMPSFHRLEQSILRAVESGGCTVRIVLLDPTAHEALHKRSSSLPRYHRAEDAARKIRDNIEIILAIQERLTERKLNAKTLLQLRLYSGFVGVSMHGIGDVFVVGLYLHGRLATEGMQIKVSGSTHPFYHELREHFEAVWRHSKDYDEWLQSNENTPS